MKWAALDIGPVRDVWPVVSSAYSRTSIAFLTGVSFFVNDRR